jgi:hypothetical protein
VLNRNDALAIDASTVIDQARQEASARSKDLSAFPIESCANNSVAEGVRAVEAPGVARTHCSIATRHRFIAGRRPRPLDLGRIERRTYARDAAPMRAMMPRDGAAKRTRAMGCSPAVEVQRGGGRLCQLRIAVMLDAKPDASNTAVTCEIGSSGCMVGITTPSAPVTALGGSFSGTGLAPRPVPPD